MTGKAPPSRSRKDKPRTSRPYDRPNQSIFGKVASTVKGLLTPSWLLNVSSWVRTNVVEEEEINANPDETIEADLTENEDEPEVQPVRPRLSGRLKRPRLECSDNATSTPERPFWLGPSTSHDKLSSKCENPPVSPIINDCDSIRKETPVIVNGDDHSENSDGSASTSGCSSLVSSQDKTHRSSGLKLSDSALELLRGELKNKPAFHRQRKEASTLTTDMLNSPHNISQGNVSLWSCRTQSPARSPQIPSLLNSSRPSFNISSFGGPAKGNSSSSKISSPFYEGSTTFGGASAYRRRPISHTPYEINRTKNLQCQVKVKENTSVKEFECMSSAAKRILHTLETMSTPVTDAKKIPSVCKSPLDIPLAITPPSHRLRSYLSISRPSTTVAPKGPPIVNLNAISKLTVLKNSHSKVRNSMMELPLKEQSVTYLPEECSISTSQYSSDTPGFSTASAGGGKMKTKLHQPLHTSSKAKQEQETVPEYELPTVPLPISSSLPVFKFNTKTIPEKTNITLQSQNAKETEEDTHGELSSDIQDIPFTFASPIEYVPPKNSLQLHKAPVVQHENAFKFSSPLVIAQKSQSDEKEIYSNRSVDDILKSLREKSSSQPSEERPNKELEVKNHSNSAEKKKKNNTSVSGFGDKFKPKQDSWTCATCWVPNDQSMQKCGACETPRDNSVNSASGTTPSSSAFGFGDKFKPKADSWECSACMVRNDEDKKKCVACETPNPYKDNTASDVTDKCEADKGHTLVKSPASAISNKLFQDTAGTWECDTCMVRNFVDKNKCVACETLRPSKEKAAGFSNSSFKFGACVTNASHATAFKFGSFVSTSVPTTTTSTFKFGVPADSAKTTSVSSNLNFGSSTKASTSTAPVVTFGESTISSKQSNDSTQDNKIVKTIEKPASEGFQFSTSTAFVSVSEPNHPASTLSSDPNGFQFSAPATLAVSVSDSRGFQFSKPLTVSAVSTSDSGGFQFGKPIVVSSAESGGFKFQSTAFGSTTFGSTVKHSVSEAVEKASEASNPAVSSTSLPSFSTNTVATSQSNASHSIVTPKCETLATTGTNVVQPGVSVFSSTAPVFSFGTIASAPAAATTTTTTTTSTVIGSGLFGSIPAQTKLKKIDEQTKSSVTSDSSQTVATSVATSAVNAQFSFNPSNVFPSIPTTAVTTVGFPTVTSTASAVGFGETNPVSSSHDQLPRTQTTTPAFSFGIASTTPSIFTFGSSKTQTTSSAGFTSTAAVAKSVSLPAASTSDTVSNVQKSSGTGLFSFGASSKQEGKPIQTGFAFKSEKEGKVNFASPSQTGFSAFQVDPSTNSAMSSVPSASVFKFGSATPTSAGGFVFGATPKIDATAPSSAAQFTFGSGTAKPAGFGVFQQNQQQPTTSSMPTFSFGASCGSLGGIDSSGVKAFTCFTAKNNQPQPPAAAISPAFGAQPAQPVFGGNAPRFGSAAVAPALLSSAATPAFGNVQAPKPEQGGGFNFNPQLSTGVFAFGSSAEKKQAVAPALPAAGFNFNMTTHVETNSNFTPSFSINSPPSFNFGATSTPTNQPFQFVASSEVASTSSPRRIRKAIRRVRKAD